MFFFLKLAMRNVLKNRRFSLTILLVVFICVFVMMFTVGYMDGFKDAMINTALKETGHISIYHRDYYENLDFSPVEYNIPYRPEINEKIKNTAGVQTLRPEINFGALANSEKETYETMVKAIDLSTVDANYVKRKKQVFAGSFPAREKEVMIGNKLAETLQVTINDSLILLSVDKYGGINAVEGIITGFFRSNIPSEESQLVICSLALAQRLLGIEGNVTEIKINISDYKKSRSIAANLSGLFSDMDTVLPWQEEQAYLEPMIAMMDISIYIILGLIIFVAGIGISNSFLMNIMQRLPEFGALRSMGLSRSQLFSMILSESFVLGIAGSLCGILPGMAIVYHFQKNPINYSAMGDFLEGYQGLETVVGTILTSEGVIAVFLTGLLISIFASIYPAVLAVKKKPVDIMRVTQ